MATYRLSILVLVLLGASCANQAAPKALVTSRNAQQEVVQNDRHRGWVTFYTNNAHYGMYIAPGFSNDMWTFEYPIGANQPSAVVDIHFDGSQIAYPVPTQNAILWGPTRGPNGNMWFAESNPGKIAEIALPSGGITEFSLPNSTEQPCALATGADGNVWFTEKSNGIIGKINITGAVTEYTLSQIQYSCGMTSGPDGNLWFTGGRYSGPDWLGYIGRITPAGIVTEFPLPSISDYPLGITVGPDSNLWVASQTTKQGSSNHIIRVDINGQMAEFAIPYGATTISSLGGQLVFTLVTTGGTLGKMSVSGVYKGWGIRGAEQAYAVALGADGNPWVIGAHMWKTSRTLIFVYVQQSLSVVPESIGFTGVGQTRVLKATESHYKDRTWTATSSNTTVATVTSGPSRRYFVVSSVGPGSCIVTVSDTMGNSRDVPVGVQ